MDKQESGKDDGMDTKEADKPLTSMDKTTEDSQGKVPEDTNNKEEIVAIETEKVNKEKDIENKEEISFDEEELSKDSAGKVARKVHQYDLAARKDDTNVMTREDLKAVFSKFGKVKFIDFHIGEDSGYVRFHRPDGAEKACAAAVLAKEEGLVVKNFIATLEPLTGDAEKEYWMRLRESKDKHRQKRGSKLIRGGKPHRSRDTDSVRGGKRHRLRDTDSVRGGKRHRSRDTVSVRGGKRHRSRDTDSVRGGRNKSQKVNSVRLPKHIANTKVFCGTALVEFSSDEEVQKILSQSLTIGSLQLELKPNKEFDAERAQKSKDFEAANSQLDAKHKENSSTKAYYIKGLIVGFQLKSILRGDQAEHNDKQESGKDDGTDTKEADKPLTSMDKTTEDSQGKVPEDANNKEEIVAMETEKVNKEKDIENKEEISFDEEELSKDSAGKDAKKERKDDLAACKDDKNVMTREDLKVVFSKFGKVKFIDFRIGEDSGYVRFHRPDGAEKARAAAVLAKEEGLVVKNFIATLEPLTGDAEKEYWMRLRENKDKHRQKRGSKLIRGGKRHRSRDTDSVRGGKRHRLRDTDSVRGGKRHRSRDTVSVRGGKRHRSRDTDSVRGGRNKSQKVNSVRLPKHIANTDAFCGTALVEFSSDEEVQKILGQSLTIGSLQLELKPKKKFDAERAQKSKDFKAANSQFDAKHKENSSTKAYYIKGLIVGFQLKSILRGDQAEPNDKQEYGKDDGTDTKEADETLTSMDKTTEDSQGKVPEDANNKEEIVAMETEKVNKEKDIENKEEISFDEDELPKDSAGKVARKEHQYDLAACKDDKNVMTREDLKAVFSKFGKVKIGEDSGYVRFHRPDGAEKACAAAVLAKEEGLLVKNFIATLEPLTGDAEKEYWMRLRENKEKHSQKRLLLLAT
ncbi:La protein 1 [Linum perenne]